MDNACDKDLDEHIYEPVQTPAWALNYNSQKNYNVHKFLLDGDNKKNSGISCGKQNETIYDEASSKNSHKYCNDFASTISNNNQENYDEVDIKESEHIYDEINEGSELLLNNNAQEKLKYSDVIFSSNSKLRKEDCTRRTKYETLNYGKMSALSQSSSEFMELKLASINHEQRFNLSQKNEENEVKKRNSFKNLFCVTCRKIRNLFKKNTSQNSDETKLEHHRSVNVGNTNNICSIMHNARDKCNKTKLKKLKYFRSVSTGNIHNVCNDNHINKLSIFNKDCGFLPNSRALSDLSEIHNKTKLQNFQYGSTTNICTEPILGEQVTSYEKKSDDYELMDDVFYENSEHNNEMNKDKVVRERASDSGVFSSSSLHYEEENNYQDISILCEKNLSMTSFTELNDVQHQSLSFNDNRK